MSLLFTTLGSVADYGTNGRWMLLGCTVVCWASQFSLLSVKCTLLILICVVVLIVMI